MKSLCVRLPSALWLAVFVVIPPYLQILSSISSNKHKKKDWILSHERNPVCVNDMFLPMNVYAKSYKRVGNPNPMTGLSLTLHLSLELSKSIDVTE